MQFLWYSACYVFRSSGFVSVDVFIFFSNPFCEISICCMIGCGETPLSGMGRSWMSGFWVNADSNWLFRLFALCLLSEISCPLFLSEVHQSCHF